MTTGKTTAKKTTKSAAKPAKAPAKSAKAAAPKAAKKTAAKSTAKTATKTTTKRSKTPAARRVEPVVVKEVQSTVSDVALRKKAFIDKVTEQSGVKRRDAKAALEAALVVLGEAIAEGQDINLPGLGKIKVTRSKTLANGKVFMTRVRQPLAKAPSDDTPTDKTPEAATAKAAE